MSFSALASMLNSYIPSVSPTEFVLHNGNVCRRWWWTVWREGGTMGRASSEMDQFRVTEQYSDDYFWPESALGGLTWLTPHTNVKTNRRTCSLLGNYWLLSNVGRHWSKSCFMPKQDPVKQPVSVFTDGRREFTSCKWWISFTVQYLDGTWDRYMP